MNTQAARPATRRPGRPATYVFDKPDSQLTESERKLKSSIEKRRLRQNRSYHRRKALRAAQENGDAAAAAAAAKPAAKTSPERPAEVPALDPAAQARLHLHQLHQQSLQQQPTYMFPTAIPPVVSYGLQSLGNASTASASAAVPSFAPSAAASAASAVSAASPANGLHALRRPTEASQEATGVGIASEVSPSAEKVDAEIDAAVIAARWGLPPPAAAPSAKLMMLAGVDLPVDELGYAIVPDGTEEDDGTEALVQNALAAAQQQSVAVVPDFADLRGAMDQQRDLLRMAGIKDIVFDNLRTQFMSMPMPIQNALRHFVVFPGSFDLRAASNISGIDAGQLIAVNAMMQHMVGANFVMSVKGRYQLNDTVKSFLCEDAAIAAIDPGDSYQVALTRFRSYYREQLEKFQDENIHKVGWRREQAMALYDAERGNMQFAEFLSQRNSRMMLRDFLSAGITVMRYCVNAVEREEILLKALDEDEVEASTHNILLKGETSILPSASDPETERVGARDQANKARLQLALSEAYFDQLKIPQAEIALMRALALMGGSESNGVPAATAAAGVGGRSNSAVSIVDAVLVLLLLSNVRMASKRVKDARALCVKALRILSQAGLGRSTFGINAMANLVAIYLEERHLDKAGVVATRLVDTLHNMGYSGMPIFADALGVCGMVSMAQERFREAEQQFGSAVEIVRNWGAKEWTARPVQHCLDLDIWLLESLAAAIEKQGRSDESAPLFERAKEMRQERGLASDAMHENDVFSFDDALEPIAERLRSAPRHLY